MRLIVLKEVILPIKAIRHIFSDLLLNSGNEKIIYEIQVEQGRTRID